MLQNLLFCITKSALWRLDTGALLKVRKGIKPMPRLPISTIPSQLRPTPPHRRTLRPNLPLSFRKLENQGRTAKQKHHADPQHHPLGNLAKLGVG